MIRSVCDECGDEPVVYSAFLYTGRVLKDGKDIGHKIDLCARHKPTRECPDQPNNCVHISFYYPEGKSVELE